MRKSDVHVQKLKQRLRFCLRLHQKIHRKIRDIRRQIETLESEPDACLPDPTVDLRRIRKEDLPR